MLCRGQWGGEGVLSGIQASASTTIIATLRDRLIVRIEFYLDHDRALRAVGRED